MALETEVDVGMPSGFAYAAGVAPLTVNFTANPSGGTAPYTGEWDFGDGSTGSGLTASHTYSQARVFAAQVTVTDSKGDKVVVPCPVVVVGDSRVSVAAYDMHKSPPVLRNMDLP